MFYSPTAHVPIDLPHNYNPFLHMCEQAQTKFPQKLYPQQVLFVTDISCMYL